MNTAQLLGRGEGAKGFKRTAVEARCKAQNHEQTLEKPLRSVEDVVTVSSVNDPLLTVDCVTDASIRLCLPIESRPEKESS